jgi:hypothetical protein
MPRDRSGRVPSAEEEAAAAGDAAAERTAGSVDDGEALDGRGAVPDRSSEVRSESPSSAASALDWRAVGATPDLGPGLNAPADAAARFGPCCCSSGVLRRETSSPSRSAAASAAEGHSAAACVEAQNGFAASPLRVCLAAPAPGAVRAFSTAAAAACPAACPAAAAASCAPDSAYCAET